MRPFLSRLVWPTALVIGLGCGGGDGGGGGPPASTLTIQKAASNSGDAQTGTVGTALANPLRVLVQRDNAPAQGVAVTWTVPTGQGSVSSSTTSTDAQGIGSVTRTLGTTAGGQTTNAAATGATGSPVTFNATAEAGPLSAIRKTGEPAQAAPGSMVTYTVTAEDQHGNPKSGVTIDWAVPAGTGSISPPQNTTGTNGQASATRTLSGSTGAHTATATAAAIPQTVTFTTTAVTAPASATVDVRDNFFSPSSVTISVGGSVTWSWPAAGSATPHNVTFSGGTGAPANISDRTTGSQPRQFNTAGTFNYDCTNHAGMSGSVTVQ